MRHDACLGSSTRRPEASPTDLSSTRRLIARAGTLLVLPVPRGRHAKEALPRQDQRPGGHSGRQAGKSLERVTCSFVQTPHERTRSVSLGPFGNPRGAPERRDRNKPTVSFMGTTYLCLGRLTGTKCLPFRLAQHLGLLRPELSTACVNLCGQVTIRSCEYRCVMSLCARSPREQ